MQSITMPPLPEGVARDEMVDSGRAEPGDCMRAAIASILELDPTLVPHFVSYRMCETTDPWLWWWALVGWTYTVGIRTTFAVEPPAGWSVVSGIGPRGYGHVVVAYDGEVVHDPHPEGGGLVSIDGYYELTPLSDAAREVLGRAHKQAA